MVLGFGLMMFGFGLMVGFIIGVIYMSSGNNDTNLA